MSNTNLNRTNSIWVWGLAGTAVAALSAVILFQFFRANSGTADETGRATAGSATAGKTRLNPTDAAPSAAASGSIAGRVSKNGLKVDISRDEVAQECIARVGKDVLDSMINRSIIQLACKEEGIEVTAAEVDQEIVRIASEFRIDIKQYIKMLETERGISIAQYRRDVIWPMLALKKLAGNEVTVTDDEIKKAFQREYGPRVKARMILCDNMRRATAAWEKAAEDPENFEKYVKEYSMDPASKSLDGSIPPIPRHSGSPNLEKAAFKLKPGEVSGIIQLDDGLNRYVILKCEGMTEPVVTQLDDQVQAELEDQIRKQKTQEQVAKVFEAIKKDTRIDNYFTGSTTAGNKPGIASKSNGSTRDDDARPSGTKSSAKGSASGSEDRPIRQASGQAPATGNRVKQASATDEDFDRQPVKRSSSATKSGK